MLHLYHNFLIEKDICSSSVVRFYNFNRGVLIFLEILTLQSKKIK